jgi:hypothetical protein
LASYEYAPNGIAMPKILQMFKGRKLRKERLRRALGLREKTAANVIQFRQAAPEIQEEYPDYEIISRWLKLADEMLGSADHQHRDRYDGNNRKKA